MLNFWGHLFDSIFSLAFKIRLSALDLLLRHLPVFGVRLG